MWTNRIIIALVALTLAMQGVILYRQSQLSRGGRAGMPPPSRPPVADAPKNSTIELSGFPIQGKPDARVVLIEFSDFECPYCARFSTTVFPEVKKTFIDKGSVQYAFANNPLPMHPNAKWLAVSAICASQQNRFWEMHEALYEKKPKDKESVVAMLPGLNIDVKKFQDCTGIKDSGESRMESDRKYAEKFQLTGTPAFVLGHVDSGNQVIADKIIMGAQPFNVFQDAIKEVLAKQHAG